MFPDSVVFFMGYITIYYLLGSGIYFAFRTFLLGNGIIGTGYFKTKRTYVEPIAWPVLIFIILENLREEGIPWSIFGDAFIFWFWSFPIDLIKGLIFSKKEK